MKFPNLPAAQGGGGTNVRAMPPVPAGGGMDHRNTMGTGSSTQGCKGAMENSGSMGAKGVMGRGV